MNVGLPVCVTPWTSTEYAGLASGNSGVTTGKYIDVIGLPFVSTRLTATPLAFPTKSFSGTNVTVPSGATVYLPSPGTTFSVDPSSNVAGTFSSIGTLGFAGTNCGLPVWVSPFLLIVFAGLPVGSTGLTVGV